MQVFEFHFNPRLRSTFAPATADKQGFGGQAKLPGLIFDSFCYEPENIYEKRVGSLYIIASLKNALPQNIHFLDRLSKVIKERYYRLASAAPEKSLKESLKEANEFLENIAKKGDVSWLGNLSFTTISLKNYELNFTKVGDLKIFLLRQGQIIDIDQKLKFEDIAPWPLKIFGNIVTGKLAENDVILVLTKEVLENFQSQNWLDKIAKILPFNEKGLKEIFDAKNEALANLSGICFLIFLGREALTAKKETISPRLQLKKFSIVSGMLSILGGVPPTIKGALFGFFPQNLGKMFFTSLTKLPKNLVKKPLKFGGTPKKLPRAPQLRLPELRIPALGFLKNIKFLTGEKRSLILVLTLIFFLILGFFIFTIQEEKQIKVYQKNLNQIQETVNQAESFLILSETNPQAAETANSLLKKSWENLSLFIKISSSLPKTVNRQVFVLKDEISKDLYQINKLVEISEPELIFEFNPKEFVPQKMIFNNENLYFFSPYSQSLFTINPQTKDKKIYPAPLAKGAGINSTAIIENSLALFSKPDKLTYFKEDKFGEIISLEIPYSDSNFIDLYSFKSNLYFLAQKSGEVVKYPYLGELKWGPPQIWLFRQTKKATDGKSMAVDGSVWILNKDNSISRYYAGSLQETIKLDVFPQPEGFSEISTLEQTPGFLYLLEPVQKRIIILNKSGAISKQYQSEKFDNLLDFAVSENGKTIWLLNDLKVYQLPVTSY